MDGNNLINEGLNLMLIGMGFVFTFLTLLVLVTAMMSRLITFYEKRVGLLPAEGIPAPTAVFDERAGGKGQGAIWRKDRKQNGGAIRGLPEWTGDWQGLRGHPYRAHQEGDASDLSGRWRTSASNRGNSFSGAA